MGTLLVLFAVFLFIRIMFNMQAGIRSRSELLGRIEGLRLNRMLTALGIDIKEYLHSENTADVYRQMKDCGDCTETGLCDEKLAGDRINADEIDFCNNEKPFREILRKRQAADTADPG